MAAHFIVYAICAICALIIMLLIIRRQYYNYEKFNDKKSNTAVVFELTSRAGFFSVFFTLCHAYIYAKKHNYDFYIKHTDWQYTSKVGWHDYMKSLKLWDPAHGYENVEYMNHAKTSSDSKYSLKDYEHAAKEIFILNDDIMRKISTSLSALPTHYNSLYIRRGDKVKGSSKEMEELDTQKILRMTSLENTSGDLFVQTDDYNVIKELKAALPACHIHTLTTENEHGSNNIDLLKESPEKRYDETVKFLIQTMIFLKGDICWSDYRSNVGRFHKLYDIDKVKLYPINSVADTINRDLMINLAHFY